MSRKKNRERENFFFFSGNLCRKKFSRNRLRRGKAIFHSKVTVAPATIRNYKDDKWSAAKLKSDSIRKVLYRRTPKKRTSWKKGFSERKKSSLLLPRGTHQLFHTCAPRAGARGESEIPNFM